MARESYNTLCNFSVWPLFTADILSLTKGLKREGPIAHKQLAPEREKSQSNSRAGLSNVPT